jgi:aminoglycoside 6'-N-acetyltransferase I
MNPRQFTVRPLRETDLDDWFRLRKQLWDETGDDDQRTEMVDILDHFDESQYVLFAQTDENKLVGFLEASIRPFVEDCHTDHVGYLEGWYVDPEFRDHGIGRELVKQAEAWARSKGCTEMASDAEVGNATSLEAHLNLNYKVTSKLVHLRKEL